MICPFCEAHKPHLADESQVRCGLCARAVEGALPWAAGACLLGALDEHECEASHTEMHSCPVGNFSAPTCGSEGAAFEADAPTPAP